MYVYMYVCIYVSYHLPTYMLFVLMVYSAVSIRLGYFLVSFKSPLRPARPSNHQEWNTQSTSISMYLLYVHTYIHSGILQPDGIVLTIDPRSTSQADLKLSLQKGHAW